ncbi:TatA/E family twin arginine-targeting protein translocase [Prochlorococcus sp. MIT 1307]|uniref:TatA/E family twin arginine-targeting protein translocase n=1 Tax=Prochlorococcus sp. MIT 1307 TaxID=3096219 RepID=UPI002A7613EF|nr:TatA/E family twin arginine-targeting protein translocase [Prochlorococcus sp. MIT 1307]
MNIFGVGLPEIAVISALALIIFGPKRLPELGRTLGKTLKGLQTASTEFEKEIQQAMSENESIEEVSKDEIANTKDSTEQK